MKNGAPSPRSSLKSMMRGCVAVSCLLLLLLFEPEYKEGWEHEEHQNPMRPKPTNQRVLAETRF